MSKFTKTVVTIGVCFLFYILFTVTIITRESSGRNTPGILGIILFVGLIGAIRAIWKKRDNDSDNNNNDNTSILQK